MERNNNMDRKSYMNNSIVTDVTYEKVDDVNRYWGNLMPMMAMEEAGELIQAISKYERSIPFKDRETYKKKLIEEMADVYISMAALRIKYDIDTDNVDSAINEKLNKKYCV
jgi:NTP pyrophosphatase (non-canonical NTP hydrolase)